MALRPVAILSGLGLGVVALCALRVALDRVTGGGVAGWRLAWPGEDGLLALRASRAATGVIVGSALAVSGAILQCLLRNPLASPDLLGVSSCASLCVVIASVFFGGAAAGAGGMGVLGWQAGPALVGALAGLAMVYALSQRRGWVDSVSMVLMGVVVGVLCGAGVVAIQAMYPTAALGAARMLVGAIGDEHGPGTLAVCGGVACTGIAAGVLLGPAMDALSLGDDEAASVGVRVRGVRLMLFACAGVLAAVGVVLAGPLGFVGLIAPHGARMVLGPGHRWLVVGSALAGAALVVGGDVLVRLIETPGGRLPLGAVMAAAGAPVIVALVRREPRVP